MHRIGPIPVWLLLCFFALSHTTETICTTSLPTLAKDLGLSGNLAQLSSSVYFAGFALGILSLGRLSDLIGRRPLIFAGMSLYFVASFACSFVDNIEQLLLLRFLQAFGASVGSVIAQAMARDSYEGSALAQVFVSISICLSFIPSLGSITGGYIVEYLGWEYNFRFLSLASGVILLLCFFHLPETNRFIGAKANQNYFSVLKSIISNKMVLTYALIIGAFNGMMFGFYLEAPFAFITLFKFTPSEYGKLGFLLSFAYLFGGLMNKYLVGQAIDNKKIIITGLTLSLIACSTLFIGAIILGPDSSRHSAILLIFVPMMLQIVGHTFAIPLILRFALEDYDEVRGTAGSIFGAIYYIIVALINYTVSRLHGASILPFASLFLMLSFICFMTFKVIDYNKNKETNNDIVV